MCGIRAITLDLEDKDRRAFFFTTTNAADSEDAQMRIITTGFSKQTAITGQGRMWGGR
jgi:hypothetical protein